MNFILCYLIETDQLNYIDILFTASVFTVSKTSVRRDIFIFPYYSSWSVHCLPCQCSIDQSNYK